MKSAAKIVAVLAFVCFALVWGQAPPLGKKKKGPPLPPPGPLPKPEVTITVEDGVRRVKSNGVPAEHGTFPRKGNPNWIRAQAHDFRMPAQPTEAKALTPLKMHPFGVALNGIPFDPGAAEWWNDDPRSGWQYEPMSGKLDLGLDEYKAHVQPTGAYHYHGFPRLIYNKLKGQAGEKAVVLMGYAADGFPIYGPYGYQDAKDATSAVVLLTSSYRVKGAQRASGPRGAHDGTFVEDWQYVANAGSLDECNGRFEVTSEYPKGTYAYHLTEDFPYIPRQFKGTPDASFFRKGPPPR